MPIYHENKTVFMRDVDIESDHNGVLVHGILNVEIGNKMREVYAAFKMEGSAAIIARDWKLRSIQKRKETEGYKIPEYVKITFNVEGEAIHIQEG